MLCKYSWQVIDQVLLIMTYFLIPDFSCLTPTKMTTMPLQMETDQRSPVILPQITPPNHREDYLPLKDCEVGYQNDKKIEVALNYVNDVNRIQVYQSPNSLERRKTNSEGSSVRTDSNDFQGPLNIEDVYNIPRKQCGVLSNEYQMPKIYCGSTSSGLDEGFVKESMNFFLTLLS